MFLRLVQGISRTILEEGMVSPVLSLELLDPHEIHTLALDATPTSIEKQLAHLFTLGRTFGARHPERTLASLLLISEVLVWERDFQTHAIVIEQWEEQLGTCSALLSFTRKQHRITRLSRPTYFLRTTVSEQLDSFLRGFASRGLSATETTRLLAWKHARSEQC